LIRAPGISTVHGMNLHRGISNCRRLFAAGTAVWLLVSSLAFGADAPAPADPVQTRLKALEKSVDFLEQTVLKQISDLAWFERMRDVADVDIVRLVGPPPHKIPNPTAQGASNGVVFNAYTFLPKPRPAGKLPLVVLVHGGVHSDFKADRNVHLVTDLMRQGYAVVAPDYRGSTGYGKDFHELIDYGGRENDDVLTAKRWMVENVPAVDSNRVAIIGWSHGGMISLMNVFDHPGDYTAAFAGVPVSDLVARMAYRGRDYEAIFAAPNHIGKTVEDDVEEYRRRSPVYQVAKLQRPLLIHTTTNDEDVNILEVEHLIQALKAEGKEFQHRIFTNAPGGHVFGRMDTAVGQEARAEVYRFLAKHLHPANPPK
jgi:dipeptidyl aminopeptidase/acylaminoacyl peptidase